MSTKYEATGCIITIGDINQVSDKFRKREFVIEIADGKYTQTVPFQMTGDRCNELDSYSIGDEVKATFNLRGRAWTSPKGEVKYFTSLDVWKLERVGQAQRSSKPAGAEDVQAAFGDGPDDSIPF